MIRINLLPYRAARTKENIRRQLSVFILMLILLLLGLFYYHMRLNSQLSRLDEEIDKVKGRMDHFTEISKEVNATREKIETIEKKLEVIRSLESDRGNSVILLNTLSELVPADRMWLTNVKAGNDVLTLEGIAKDERTVAEFMTSMETKGNYFSVDLKTLKQKTVEENLQLKSFEIACRKLPPLPPAQETQSEPKDTTK